MTYIHENSRQKRYFNFLLEQFFDLLKAIPKEKNDNRLDGKMDHDLEKKMNDKNLNEKVCLDETAYKALESQILVIIDETKNLQAHVKLSFNKNTQQLLNVFLDHPIMNNFFFSLQQKLQKILYPGYKEMDYGESTVRVYETPHFFANYRHPSNSNKAPKLEETSILPTVKKPLAG